MEIYCSIEVCQTLLGGYIVFSKLCHVMIIALIGYRDTPPNYKKIRYLCVKVFPNARLISNTAVYVQRHLSCYSNLHF